MTRTSFNDFFCVSAGTEGALDLSGVPLGSRPQARAFEATESPKNGLSCTPHWAPPLCSLASAVIHDGPSAAGPLW